MRQKSKNLVSQYLENVSRKVLEEYSDIVRKYVRNRNGVYALYSKQKLYYVGLATDLRARLKHHLKDRHANTWDNFSIYLTVGDNHLRELEALLLRISMPDGNRQKGKFGYAQDLEKTFRHDVKTYQNSQLDGLFCNGAASRHAENERADSDSKAVLAGYVKRSFPIKFHYKGKWHIARVRKDGFISFKGQKFKSPSKAAYTITKCGVNGWRAWTYERAPGDWVTLNELRKK